jgi:hypothetical protein
MEIPKNDQNDIFGTDCHEYPISPPPGGGGGRRLGDVLGDRIVAPPPKMIIFDILTKS